MNNITNRMEIPSSQLNLNRSLPVKPTTRIKIVKKQKAAEAEAAAQNASQMTNPRIIVSQQQQQDSLRLRSVSPGVLRRAPDIIETIETKTSMSFIMNKSVNLVVEEKREPPPLPPRHSSVRSTSVAAPLVTGLSSAISQPQLYQTRIDDLIHTANNLIKNSSSNNTYDSTRHTSTSGTNKTVYRSKFKINSGAFKKVGDNNDENDDDENSMPIPISVQSRSKSEPKLDLEFDNYVSCSPRVNSFI